MKQVASRERLRLLTFDGPDSGAPTQVPLARPHISLPPLAANGRPCAGFSLVLLVPASGDFADPAPGGFTVTVYRLVTTVGRWARVAEFTGLGHDQQIICRDVGAGALLFFRLGGLGPGGGEEPDYGSMVLAVAAVA